MNHYEIGINDNDFREYIDSCIMYNWKVKNVIEWLKSDGKFKRCSKCNCIYSYEKNVLKCINKYCENI